MEERAVTLSDKVVFIVKYQDQTAEVALFYSDYFKDVLVKAMEAFSLPETDAKKYCLKFMGERLFNTGRIYDARNVNDHDTLVLELK
jgi:hypothetical protein